MRENKGLHIIARIGSKLIAFASAAAAKYAIPLLFDALHLLGALFTALIGAKFFLRRNGRFDLS